MVINCRHISNIQSTSPFSIQQELSRSEQVKFQDCLTRNNASLIRLDAGVISMEHRTAALAAPLKREYFSSH